MDVLPSEFDLIVVGTGLVESIVAAAASRIGKSVLHVDNREYYGGPWASFNLESIEKFSRLKGYSKENIDEPHNKKVSIERDNTIIKDIKITWHILENMKKEESLEADADKTKIEEKATVRKVEILMQNRKFNIDLAPKLHFARGKFVELLISSNISRYSEFRSVSRILTYKNDKLEVIPCSRADIFTNSNVNVLEKRMLMKLLEICLSEDPKSFENYTGKTFREFLMDKKLTDNLIHFIIHAIAMSGMEVECLEGVKRVRRFMESLGRFGKTPFLYAMFGSGELPQAFCRLCAVFGGVYALILPIEAVEFDDECVHLHCNEQNIKAKHLVTSGEYILRANSEINKGAVSRAIFLTEKSIMDSEGEHLTLLLFPSEDGKEVCQIIEAGSQTGTTPKGFFLVYLSIKQTATPEEDLKYFTDKLFNNSTDAVNPLWSCYFTLPLYTENEKFSKNVHLAAGPGFDLDYDESIEKAREIFVDLYPDEDFLPRAPDPEEIIFGDDDAENNTDKDVNSQKNDEAQKVTHS